MSLVVGVKLRKTNKITDFRIRENLRFQQGDCCIVQGEDGKEAFGEMVTGPRKVEKNKDKRPFRLVLRQASERDLEFVRKHEKLEKEAFDVCQQRIEERSLLMKLVGVEFIFDGSKAIFYFTANKRVDFRELIRDLAHRFRIRIEMRQIGVRDEARMFGGFGVCGRNLCCNSFLCEFQPVTVSMAKEQNLTLDPAKISGICGRLMCCLTFELDCPEKFKRKSKSAEKVSSPGASNAKTMGFSIDSKTIKEGKEEVITVPNLSECSSLCGKEGKKAGE